MPEKKEFILSDESINSYGFSIDMEKLQLERFMSNPVMLYNHNELVGKWSNLKVEKGRLTGTPVFMEDEDEVLAAKIKKRVEKDFVKGASLGIRILSVEKKEGQTPKVEAEVMECSVVDIPSNKNAITLYNSEGVKLKGEAFKLALSRILKPIKHNKEMKLNAKSYVALGLIEGASDSDVNSAIETLSKKLKNLEAKEQAEIEQKVNQLITTALGEGRITADQKSHFEELASTNFELAKVTIAALPTKKELAGREKPENGGEDRSDWTFSDWRKKDTAGLLAIKKDNPDKYKEIINK